MTKDVLLPLLPRLDFQSLAILTVGNSKRFKFTDLCNYSQRQEFRAQPNSEPNTTKKKKKTQKVERDDSSGGPRLGRLGPLLQPHYQNIMEDDQINWSPTVDDRLQAALRENMRPSKIIS